MLALHLPAAALAQSVQEDGQRLQSVLVLDRPGYEPRRIQLGNIVILPELDASSIYDSNVYASPNDRKRDVSFRIKPRLSAEKNDGKVRWRAAVSGELRRYASLHNENSESYGAEGAVSAALGRSLNLSGLAGYRRAVENRSDPEVRQNPTLGPPLFDVVNGELTLQGGRGKFGVSIKGQVEKYDFVSPANDDRDFTSYRGTVRLLYRLAPYANGFVQGYVNQRNFRMRDPDRGVSRDGRTVGGLIGVQIDPGGKLRGDIGAGYFQYRPESEVFRRFSGFALDGSIVYLLRPRTALIVDAFSGDVATVRNGASGRIDRSARFSIQQEIRHNLVASAGLRYRQTRYRGIAERLTTAGGDVDFEYLMSRHISLALIGQYTRRTGGDITDRFDRVRAGIEIRARY